MAINDSQNNNGQENNGHTDQPRTERQEYTQQERTQERAAPAASILDINRLLGGNMSRRISGESLVDAIKAVKYWLDPEREVSGNQTLELDKLQVLGLDAAEYAVGVSSVILAYPVETQGITRVLTSTLVLEGTLVEEAPTRSVEVNHRQYVLPIVAGDYVTESYLKLVEDITIKAFTGTSRKQVEAVSAGWRVVDDGVDFGEIEATETRSVIFYAQAALSAMYMEIFHPETFFSLDWLNHNSQLEINVDMSGRDVPTADGLPRRSDLAVSISGQVRKGENIVNVPLSQLGGYVNIMYTPPAQEDRWSRTSRRDEPYFTPTFVINRMDSSARAITPELLLLALAASSVISRNEAWAQNFIPGDNAKGEVDARDSGLLNILGPDEDKVPVVFDNRQSLDIEKWGQYFFTLVDHNLAWAIELEEGGDNSWITSLLTDAALDNSPNNDAIRRLYSYADRLTNNNFTRRAMELGVERPLVMSNARYLVGTWIDEDGKKRDTREWDLLRWLAVNPNDGGASALDYQDVIDRTDLDTEVRVSEQYAQLTGTLSNTAVDFSRYVDLAFIDPKFIEALALAVADCQINIDQRSAYFSFGAPRVRGNARVRDFVGGDLTHGMLSRRGRPSADGQRNMRGTVSNGFGRGSSF